jgi:hypothetical protein
MENTYKLRAECLSDWHKVAAAAAYYIVGYEVKFIPFPDIEVVVTLRQRYGIEDLKVAISKVPDSHVMLETVEPLESYTGERKF